MLHNALRVSRLTQGFSRICGLDQSEEGVARLSETLMPVLDAWRSPEFAHPRGELLCIGHHVAAAGGAGTFTKVQLVNPAGSGLLVMVDEFWINTPTPGVVLNNMAIAVTAGWTNQTLTQRLDARAPWTQVNLATAQLWGLVDATTPGNQIGLFSGTANRTDITPFQIILTPGTCFLLRHATVQVAMTVHFRWRERVAQPSELAPS